jgi:inorganic pyrophosphatase
MTELPARAEVIVDVPRFSYVKRRDDGSIDFISPWPCPFNYGSVPGTISGDGDRIDAVVLGPRVARHTRRFWPVVGVVLFLDAGERDPKWICADRPLDAIDRLQLAAFFHVYAQAKRALNLLRRRPGATRFEGLRLPSK